MVPGAVPRTPLTARPGYAKAYSHCVLCFGGLLNSTSSRLQRAAFAITLGQAGGRRRPGTRHKAPCLPGGPSKRAPREHHRHWTWRAWAACHFPRFSLPAPLGASTKIPKGGRDAAAPFSQTRYFVLRTPVTAPVEVAVLLPTRAAQRAHEAIVVFSNAHASPVSRVSCRVPSIWS